jgi:pyroglutamyl-peptidase
MKIMITGFGRFGNHKNNPTKEILRILPKSIYGHELIKVELPVIFDECYDYLKQFIDIHQPDAIIMLGLAGGSKTIRLERIAVNLKDAKIADNIGSKPLDEPIIKNGKNAYFSTLPLREMEAILIDKEIPVSISNSAGLFVCNNIFYHVMHRVDQEDKIRYAGFIHLPYMDEDKTDQDAFSMPLYTLNEAVIDCIKMVLK